MLQEDGETERVEMDEVIKKSKKVRYFLKGASQIKSYTGTKTIIFRPYLILRIQTQTG